MPTDTSDAVAWIDSRQALIVNRASDCEGILASEAVAARRAARFEPEVSQA